MKSKFVLCYAALGSALACGDGGGDEDDGSSPPSEQVLCSLSIGESSQEEVIAALGPATAVTSSGGLVLLNYDYGGSGVALSLGDVSTLMLVLDDDVFFDATAINVPFPDCWTRQIEARDEARGL